MKKSLYNDAEANLPLIIKLKEYMPRWKISDEDLQDLMEYLKSLQ